MTVRLDGDGAVLLEGACPIEDAEALLQALLARPDAAVDWRGCTGAHTAVVQVLLLSRRRLHGPPASPALARWIGPALLRGDA